MSNALANSSSLFLYQTEDGQTRVQCRFENETVWLTHALLLHLREDPGQHPKKVLQEKPWGNP